MNTKLKRALGGLVAMAIVGVAPLLSASPAAAATLAGPATVKTAGGGADLNAGDANDLWTLRLPAGAACAADGNSGGRWHTYMVPGSENPVTDLAFAGNGALVGASTGTGGTGTFRNNIYSNTNNPVRGNPPNLGDAAVINIPNMAYTAWAAGNIPSGVYNIGIACVDLDLASAIDNIWNTKITVTYPGGDAAGAQISWAVGEPPVAPVITTITPGDTTLSVAFTHTASTPASTYTASAVPDSLDADCTGGTVPAGPVAGSPVPMTGLVNSCTYAVTVTANNGVGTPATSAPVNATPNPGRPPVSGLTGTPAATPGTADINWSYAGPAANGYTVTVSTVAAPGVPVGSVTVDPFPATHATVSGLTAGTQYTATVTPTYAAPPAGTPATSAAFTVNSAQSIVQNIEVDRPVGNIVLTQRCGVYGPLDIDAASPGFAELPGEPAAGGTTGTAPFEAWDQAAGTGTGGSGWQGPGNQDPNFPEYPYPIDEADGSPNPNYPTHCGVDLGYGKLVTSGTGSGQFFATHGRINQITIVDTRDTDGGWTVNGTVSDFTRPSGGSDSFDGNHLGWNPDWTSDSEAYDTDLNGSLDYNQTAVEGSIVLPRATGAAGMKAGQPLATAAPGSGLGIAVFDARLKLLIPVVNNNARYTATLTFSVV